MFQDHIKQVVKQQEKANRDEVMSEIQMQMSPEVIKKQMTKFAERNTYKKNKQFIKIAYVDSFNQFPYFQPIGVENNIKKTTLLSKSLVQSYRQNKQKFEMQKRLNKAQNKQHENYSHKIIFPCNIMTVNWLGNGFPKSKSGPQISNISLQNLKKQSSSKFIKSQKEEEQNDNAEQQQLSHLKSTDLKQEYDKFGFIKQNANPENAMIQFQDAPSENNLKNIWPFKGDTDKEIIRFPHIKQKIISNKQLTKKLKSKSTIITDLANETYQLIDHDLDINKLYFGNNRTQLQHNSQIKNLSFNSKQNRIKLLHQYLDNRGVQLEMNKQLTSLQIIKKNTPQNKVHNQNIFKADPYIFDQGSISQEQSIHAIPDPLNKIKKSINNSIVFSDILELLDDK